MPRTGGLHFIITPLVVVPDSENRFSVQALSGGYDGFLGSGRWEGRGVAVEACAAGALVAGGGIVGGRVVGAAFLGVEGVAEGGDFEAFVVLGDLGKY